MIHSYFDLVLTVITPLAVCQCAKMACSIKYRTLQRYSNALQGVWFATLGIKSSYAAVGAHLSVPIDHLLSLGSLAIIAALILTSIDGGQERRKQQQLEAENQSHNPPVAVSTIRLGVPGATRPS